MNTSEPGRETYNAMSEIAFGNAPCSWGTIEGWGQGVPYPQMLDELVASGYRGTELGDYGYFPTDPERLREELVRRGLTLLGAYEGVYLKDPAAVAEGRARVMRTARLLQHVADVGDPHWRPYLVLADEHSRDPLRFRHAGRITPELSLDPEGWTTFCTHAEQLAREVFEETGLSTVFHHHCAGYVEAPWEIEAFLERTDPRWINLLLDTGHYLYGTGSVEGDEVVAALERYRERIRYVHFKDLDPIVATQARREGWNYKEAVAHGVFCQLGQGAIDFRAVLRALRKIGYSGWVTVEQDVLPGMGSPKESAEASLRYLEEALHDL